MTDAPRALRPTITYSHLNEPGEGVVGEGPELYNVVRIDCWRRGELLEVWASGRMRKLDGEPSRVTRCREVWPTEIQPEWLQRVIADAERRMSDD